MKKIIYMFSFMSLIAIASEEKFKVDLSKYPYTIFFQDPDTDQKIKSLVKNEDVERIEEIINDNVSPDAQEGDVQVFLFKNGEFYMTAVVYGWISKDVVNQILNLNPSRARNPLGIE